MQDLSSTKIELSLRELKELREAVTPVVALFATEGDNERPLLELVKEVPGRIKAYVKEMAKGCVRASLTVPPQLAYRHPRHHFARVEERESNKSKRLSLGPTLVSLRARGHAWTTRPLSFSVWFWLLKSIHRMRESA